MRAVIQRVSASEVRIGNESVGKIAEGLNVLLGIKEDDTETDMDYIINKLVNLRIFEDADGKMNRSILDVDGELLLVSQFTLYGDCRKGRRPGFTRSGPVDQAEKKYAIFVDKLKDQPIKKIETGVFQAEMEVLIVNDGPVTLLLDSEKKF
ncbi:D-aminoacyl-tRNA deacylase [Acetobacterium carbinolicum]|jgi:D-tyrosyl-tRNA(Tyr) deacylase|uniref:D-aminoacyl-tRNA deacylase n=1 Tax=Acetobacterium TaxID=33951 RepID=UPI000DBEB4E4|nr:MULTISPECIES: D-aminoacyl-tRNA deacylase [unclassified Acetobacterium]AWW25345.1 D-tyrosyl-tRNA(Tyr) deacylase [Acetobacterium sp. KB-1]MDK2942469.1 D-aminoacyl-tRNA deacylase [Acetobacterium sp.]MDZ5723854.1 D-aminoacyl-tRNA deacylase [Acetobacterium sp. K1/6]